MPLVLAIKRGEAAVIEGIGRVVVCELRDKDSRGGAVRLLFDIPPHIKVDREGKPHTHNPKFRVVEPFQRRHD